MHNHHNLQLIALRIYSHTLYQPRRSPAVTSPPPPRSIPQNIHPLLPPLPRRIGRLREAIDLCQRFPQRDFLQVDDLGLLDELPKQERGEDEADVAAVKRRLDEKTNVRGCCCRGKRTYRYEDMKELDDQLPRVKTAKPAVKRMTTQKKRATGVEKAVVVRGQQLG